MKVTSSLVSFFIIFIAIVTPSAPGTETGPSEQFVSVAVTWLEVEELDSFKMEIKVRLEIEETWTERTLWNISTKVFHPQNILELDDSNRTQFWSPEQPLVQNGREVVRTGSTWTLHPNQRRHVLIERMAVRLGCFLDFSMYPFDHQRCHVQLLLKNFLRGTASPGYKLGGGERNHVQTDAAIFASPFSIVATSAALLDNSLSWPSTVGIKDGQGSKEGGQRLLVTVHVRRSWSAYVGSYFLPMSSFVFISLLTLWLVYPKISVMVNFINIILVNIFLLLHRNSLDIPKVYYVTAMSAYSFTSVLFIVLVLLVNVYVLYYIKSEEEDDEEKARRRRPHDLNIRNDIKFVPPSNNTSGSITTIQIRSPGHEVDDNSSGDTGHPPSTWILVRRKIMDRIRRNSHWALLTTFLLFNFVYWVSMLSVHYTQ